jgi:O-antigen/teichoic acid export membrane protein
MEGLQMPVVQSKAPPSTPSAGQSKRVQKIAANSVWVTLDTVVGFGSGFVASILVARAFGPEKLGYYSYLIWVTNVIGSPSNFGIPMATRKYMAEYIGRGSFAFAKHIMGLGLRFQAYVSAIVVALGLLLVYTVVPPQHRTYAMLAVLSLAPTWLNSVASAANMAAQDFAANVRPSVVSTVVNLVGVLLTIFLGWGLVGLAASLLVSRAVDAIYRHWLFHQRVGAEWKALMATAPDQSDNWASEVAIVRKRMVRFCLQSGFLQLLTIVVWDRSEMFFLQRFREIQQVAFYSLAFNITQQLLLFPRVFATAANANLLNRVGEEPEKTGPMAITVLRYMMIAAFPLTLGMAALSAPVTRLLYGHAYDAVIPVLAILALFGSAKAMAVPAQQLIIAMDRQDIIIKLMIAAGVFNIAVDLALIPRYGALGAAIGNSAAQVLGAAIIWVGACRLAHIKFPVSNMGKLLIATVAMALIAAAVAYRLPTVPAIIFGTIAGAGAFFLLLRLAGVLTIGDGARLLALELRVPGRLRGIYRRGVAFVSVV